ncbi:MAG: hypothetical protein R3C19_18595 [Planctomycetaceae bacterium]
MINAFDPQTGIWLCAGLLAGLAHVTMLWRAAHRLTSWAPVFAMARFVVVGTILTAAALAGHVAAAAIGWTIGFAIPATLLAFRRAVAPTGNQTQSSSRGQLN